MPSLQTDRELSHTASSKPPCEGNDTCAKAIMTFFDKQKPERRKSYIDGILSVLPLSYLFATKETNFLDPKILEYIFCDSFNTYRISQGNEPFDAVTNNQGVALKTFVSNGGQSYKEYEKISQFKGKKYGLNFSTLSTPEKLTKQIAVRYNSRIRNAMDKYDIRSAVYHVIIRNKLAFDIMEFPLELMDFNKLVIDNNKTEKSADGRNWHSITFSSGPNKFRFTTSDSQLYYQFSFPSSLWYTTRPRLRAPLRFIKDSFLKIDSAHDKICYSSLPFFIVPLYNTDRNGRKSVELGSGLNAWNCKPRPKQTRRRNYEVYIPLNEPCKSHAHLFFPKPKVSFDLVLPGGNSLSSKITSQGGKSIYSNPNKYLGLWLLDRFRAAPKYNYDVITFQHMTKAKTDSLIFFKVGSRRYEVFFAPLGYFELFRNVSYDYKDFPKDKLSNILENYQLV